MTACKGPQTREEDWQCQIRWHDQDTDTSNSTEFMPKAEAVKRAKAITSSPGFSKMQTAYWVYCK